MITTTYHHPFYDVTQAAFVDAADLKPGDKPQRPDGRTATVLEARRYHDTQVTYDLTINGLHTYYVSAGTSLVLVLVHNCGNHPYDRPGQDFTDSERQKVYDDNFEKNGEIYACDYCGQQVTRRPSRVNGVGQRGLPDDAQIDHVKTRVSGGCGSAHNGCVACRRCNGPGLGKGTKSVEEWDDELHDHLDE